MKNALLLVPLLSLASCVAPPAPPPPPVAVTTTKKAPYCPPAKKTTVAVAKVEPKPAEQPSPRVRVDISGRRFDDTPPEEVEPVKSRPVVLDR